MGVGSESVLMQGRKVLVRLKMVSEDGFHSFYTRKGFSNPVKFGYHVSSAYGTRVEKSRVTENSRTAS